MKKFILLLKMMSISKIKLSETSLNSSKEQSLPDNNLNRKLDYGKLKLNKLLKAISKLGNLTLQTFTTTHQDQATLEALISLTPTKLSKSGEMQSKLIRILVTKS